MAVQSQPVLKWEILKTKVTVLKHSNIISEVPYAFAWATPDEAQTPCVTDLLLATGALCLPGGAARPGQEGSPLVLLISIHHQLFCVMIWKR